jgi:putative nucleotidyltransferase with HDIG domain
MLRTRLIAGTMTGIILSAVCATVLMLVQSVDTIFEPLRVDPSSPAPVTLRLPSVTLRDTSASGLGRLRVISPVVGRGDVVRDPHVAELVRVYERSRRPPRPASFFGFWVLYFLIATMLSKYMRTFSPSRGALLRTHVGVLSIIVAMLVVSKLLLLYTTVSPSLLPLAAVPMWISLYLDRRTAFVVSIALSILISSFLGFNLTVIAVHLASGIAASLLLWDRKHTAVFFYGGLSAAFAATIVLATGKMISQESLKLSVEPSALTQSELITAALGGLLSGVVAFSLRSVTVLVLGAVSRTKLLDLTDLDHPLLQKMAREAPGSWEHSRAMANLAEAAAASIGADSLLTRVGAYYHDLGKTCQSKFFVENLEYGERSPHEDLEPDISADAIMAHVVEGVRILRRAGIPEPVVEFAYTHHGTTTIEYFWHKCIDQGNPKKLPQDFFRYPGMKPRSKETAILMLIDSIEAASRTIHPPEREKFQEMVQRVVFVKLNSGQLDESGLTLKDIRILSTRIVDTLVSFYHSRIRYPWQNAAGASEQQAPASQRGDDSPTRRQRPSDPPPHVQKNTQDPNKQDPSQETAHDPTC